MLNRRRKASEKWTFKEMLPIYYDTKTFYDIPLPSFSMLPCIQYKDLKQLFWKHLFHFIWFLLLPIFLQ